MGRRSEVVSSCVVDQEERRRKAAEGKSFEEVTRWDTVAFEPEA
jgi:hypothetical protein